jgi:radical SAM protein with 4Fe4S-binding SPASM domain
MVSICPDGEVTGCNFIERSVGNVRTEPLSIIWDRLMTDYNDTNWQEGPCNSCSKYSSCGTGCKAFHLPWQSHFDKRCENQRFGDSTPLNIHGLRRSHNSRFLPVISN